MTTHEDYMRRAISVARRNPSCPFGAILVDRESNTIVAEGLNRTGKNPTWHGEIDAINAFVAAENRPDWTRLDLYTTAEPCPMCQAAILWAGIPGVIFGTSIRRLQQLGWSQIDIPAERIAAHAPFARCEIVGGILQADCDRLFQQATAH